MQACDQQVDSNEIEKYEQESDNSKPCRLFTLVAPVESQMQEYRIEHECDERPGLFRIPAPEPAPCDLCPDCSEENASESEHRESDDDGTIADFIHQIEVCPVRQWFYQSRQALSDYLSNDTVNNETGKYRPEDRIQFLGVDQRRKIDSTVEMIRFFIIVLSGMLNRYCTFKIDKTWQMILCHLGLPLFVSVHEIILIPYYGLHEDSCSDECDDNYYTCHYCLKEASPP